MALQSTRSPAATPRPDSAMPAVALRWFSSAVLTHGPSPNLMAGADGLLAHCAAQRAGRVIMAGPGPARPQAKLARPARRDRSPLAAASSHIPKPTCIHTAAAGAPTGW